MGQTWFAALRDRISGGWDVLTGRAYAAYSLPDHSGEIQLRAAVAAYLKETDNPVPDGMYRRVLQDHLRDLLGIPKRA